MKSTLNFITKSGLLLSALILTAAAHAASFTATASGNWGDGSSWTGGTAPSFNVTGDTIVIPSGIDITLNNNVTIDGALSMLAVEGTLSAVDNTTLTISGGLVAGAGTIDVTTIILETGLNFSFTGTVSADNLTTSIASWQTTGTVNVDENLTLQAGQLHFLSGGTFNLDNEAKITRDGGEITSNDGSLNFPNNYSVEYKGTGAVNTGIEIDHSGLQDVLINTGSAGVVTLNTDLTLRGTLYLNSGTLNLGNYDLLIEGNIADGGTGVIASSDTSDVKITGTSAISGSLRFSSAANEVRDFTLDIGSNNHAELEGSLEVTGNFKLSSGILNLNNADLTITGNVGDGDGTLSSTETSSITINTVTSPSGDLEFENGGNTVNDFTLNITNGGAFELASDMNVAGTLTLTKGRLDADGYKITINDGGDLSGGADDAYIVTGNDGRLSMNLNTGLLPTTFPVGTETRYLPAGVTLALLSTAGRVDVGVMPNVYSEGTTGIDFSNNQPIVDATWMVSSDITDDLDMSLRVSWPIESEVNGFARNACYISHYDGSWDSPSAGIATGSGGMYSISRTNITELSPFAVFDENTNTSVKDVLAEAGLRVYPNPSTSGQLYIDNNKGTVLNMDIINIHGETVGSYKLDAQSNTVPVDELAQGCYTIRLYNGDFNVSSRFIKL